MRVLTWNMDHWKRRLDQREGAWRFLDEQRSTVALLQEANPPEEHSAAAYSECRSSGPRWGSAVLAPGLEAEPITSATVGGKTFELRPSHAGGFAIADVDVPDFGVITCVSLYGVLDQGWAITTVHRLLSDLAPLLYARR